MRHATSRRRSACSPIDFEDFQSLPPALRRKYFSSLERLRLAQDGHDSLLPPPPPSSRLSIYRPKSRHPHTSPFFFRLSHLDPGVQHDSRPTGNRLQKKSSPTEDITEPTPTPSVSWFASLPPPVQRRLFSRQECDRYSRTTNPVILDAADETLRRRSWHANRSLGPALQPKQPRRDFSTDDFRYHCEGGVDSGVDMGDYTVNDFPWLEDETELDLRLFDYHEAIAQTARRTSMMGDTRRPSRRKTSLSSISVRLGRSSTSSSRVQLDSPVTPALPANSSGTTSPSLPMQHIRSQASFSSIDPRPTHYRDPAARLKLRLYLASPQKFDEAIEFGFPSVHAKSPRTPIRPMTSPARAEDNNRTFFHDDTPELSGDEDDELDEPDHMYDPRTPEDSFFHMHRPTPKPSVDGSNSVRPFNPRRLPETYGRGSPSDREMTLHMTLTRPDLRDPEAKPSEPANINRIPLDRPELHLDGDPTSIWDTLPAEESKVRRILRKLRLK